MIHIIPKPTDTPTDNSTGMVQAELKKRGVPFVMIDLPSVDPFNLPVCGETIWACGIKQDGVQFELLKALELENRVINSPEAIATCASKVTTTAKIIRAGAPSPDTCFTNSKDVVQRFLDAHDGKAVYKPVYGFDGNGIYLFHSVDEIKEEPPYYVQEYVKNDRDYRIFVIDNQAVGAIKRESAHLTHNIHQGGCGMAVEIPKDMAYAAEEAARAVGIDYCGVDLLPLEGGGYTVLEVNGTPNWHCMTAPIPKLLADYLIRQDKEGRE
ncbi:MAG TPA: ATP-grasp domain-containing protein [Methanocorpusculum sp.]|nr:ATP-grasp domain-containing protein [Methanocorpusculum sp.]HKL98243.1 ATP-grasp domain-containing protein [Methanocorpusculum sp.]